MRGERAEDPPRPVDTGTAPRTMPRPAVMAALKDGIGLVTVARRGTLNLVGAGVNGLLSFVLVVIVEVAVIIERDLSIE